MELIVGNIIVSLTLLGTFVGALNDPVLSPLLFYPFGSDVGDSVIPPNDDGTSGSVTIDVGFPFFATSNTELFVSIAELFTRLNFVRFTFTFTLILTLTFTFTLVFWSAFTSTLM